MDYIVKDDCYVMKLNRIMVCLDGSKNSLRGLDAAIVLAKKSNAKIIAVHSETTHGLFTAVHLPKIPEDKWSDEIRGIISKAKDKTKSKDISFEGIAIAGRSAGIDLTTFANNPKNKIDHIVIGARGIGFPKTIFLGSTSNFILHKAKAPVTIVK